MGPVVAGDTAWGKQSVPPVYEPDRSVGLAFHLRRWPAAVRLIGYASQEYAALIDEATAWQIARKLSALDTKRVLARVKPERSQEADMLAFIRATPVLNQWWRSTLSWRSPRAFSGWRELEKELGVPHITPNELARLRLTDDVAMDGDVLCLSAWCQGVGKEWAVRAGEHWVDHRRSQLEGIRKLHNSPWISLSLAAPFMQPVGIFFPGVGYLESTLRMERLLKNPLQATDGELGHILVSQTYRAARERAIAERRRGRYALPAGQWYACGMASPLGEHFRRGGSHTARRGGG